MDALHREHEDAHSRLQSWKCWQLARIEAASLEKTARPRENQRGKQGVFLEDFLEILENLGVRLG